MIGWATWWIFVHDILWAARTQLHQARGLLGSDAEVFGHDDVHRLVAQNTGSFFHTKNAENMWNFMEYVYSYMG